MHLIASLHISTDFKVGVFPSHEVTEGMFARDLLPIFLQDHGLRPGAADGGWRATLQLLTQMVCFGCIICGWQLLDPAEIGVSAWQVFSPQELVVLVSWPITGEM